MKGFKAIFVMMVSLLVLQGCATAPDKEIDTSNLVWPLPPEKPRVKFIKIFHSNLDVEKKGALIREILGEDRARLKLEYPKAVAVDSIGRIYVSHRYGILVFDEAGEKVYRFGNAPGPGQVKNAWGMDISPDNRVFIADTELKRVLVYDTTGKFLYAIGRDGDFGRPIGVAIDSSRMRLYVTDVKRNALYAFDLNGQSLFSVMPGQDAPPSERLSVPTQVAVDSQGYIYVVDQMGTKINVYGPEGKFVRNIGYGLGVVPGQFVRPKGIAIDSEDHVYVTDAAFNNFQIFDREGKLLLFVGAGGPRPGQFDLPSMLCIDRQDRIYVVDRANHRVQVFQYLKDSGQDGE